MPAMRHIRLDSMYSPTHSSSAPRPLSVRHQLNKGLGWALEPVWIFLEKRKALSPART